VKSGKLILSAIVWLIVLAVGVSLWKLVIEPMQNTKNAQQAKREEEEVLQKSTGNSIYKDQLTIAADAFSGYAVLRSEAFIGLAAQQGIHIKVEDDQANYSERLAGLASGKYAMAAFPIDALIKASASANQLPATIVCLIDETRGADAIVANKTKYPDVDSLNNAETKFVLVGDSPSETLARVVMNNFELAQMSPQPFVSVSTPEDVLRQYRNATPTTPQLYVTWEPYVSELLASDPQLQVVVDSSSFTGYVVDALVVSRNYLVKNQTTVEKVLECYFRALYGFNNAESRDAMKKLVMDDAKQTGTKLGEDQAGNLVSKIQWKNTQENFAHMGLREGKLFPLENMIERIMKVLLQTKAIDSDPTAGQITRLFYDAPMAQLQSRDFHPGLSNEAIAEQAVLPQLSDAQWEQLVSVGTLSVPDLVFARGSAQLTDSSRATLEELSQNLQSWPKYYLRIRGSALAQGNLEANKELALRRAKAAEDHLRSLGVGPSRMHVVGGVSNKQAKVTFELGQPSY
jgi:outer membrane protein OmpA-like peptidoglycan-associated protein